MKIVYIPSAVLGGKQKFYAARYVDEDGKPLGLAGRPMPTKKAARADLLAGSPSRSARAYRSGKLSHKGGTQAKKDKLRGKPHAKNAMRKGVSKVEAKRKANNV